MNPLEALDGDSPDVQAMLEASYKSTPTFGHTFMPEAFKLPFSPKIHTPIFNLLDDHTKPLVAIAAPRGAGKTTIANAYMSKKILFREANFILSISETATKAEEQSQNLKRELTTNPLIKATFGSMRPTNVEDDFSKLNWMSSTGTRITPKGAGQQIRGLQYIRDGHPYRPDLIVVDDLENDESVMSDHQRMKLKRWFFSSLRQVVDRSHNRWKIVVIGTILHEQSLLNDLLSNPAWASIRLEICDDNFKSYWPAQISDAKCRETYEEYRTMGVADEWMREFRNLPIAKDEADFREAYFQYYKEEEEDLDSRTGLGKFILCDPARSVTDRSCDTAIVGVAVDYDKNLIYIRDVINGRFYPDEIYKHLIAMSDRLKTKDIVIEQTGLNEFIRQPLDNENSRSGAYLKIDYVPAKGDKDARILTLSPYYRMGLVKHNKSGVCDVLEQQLLRFPRGLKDVPDALSYIVEEFAV
jgi:predicted phage terminase large subunit-like protein